MKISGYLTVYFTQRGGEIVNCLSSLIENLIQLCPPMNYWHLGKKPSSGRLRRFPPNGLNLFQREMENFVDMDPQREIHLNLQNINNGSFVSDYHLIVWCSNLTYFPEYRIYHPNFLQLYFPCDRAINEDLFLDSVIKWLEDSMIMLDGCYGYINPVVMYDMYHVAKENLQVLEILKYNLILDLFDDFNSIRQFTDHIKSPMWYNILSKNHLTKMRHFEPNINSTFAINYIKNEKIGIRMKLPFGVEPTFERLEIYSVLGLMLSNIALPDFDPVLFKFPYRYPEKASKSWVRRFVEKCDTSWW